MISNISKKYNVIGYHLYARNSLNNSSVHCRNFAPLYGIPEESATEHQTAHWRVICLSIIRLRLNTLKTCLLRRETQ